MELRYPTTASVELYTLFIDARLVSPSKKLSLLVLSEADYSGISTEKKGFLSC